MNATAAPHSDHPSFWPVPPVGPPARLPSEGRAQPAPFARSLLAPITWQPYHDIRGSKRHVSAIPNTLVVHHEASVGVAYAALEPLRHRLAPSVPTQQDYYSTQRDGCQGLFVCVVATCCVMSDGVVGLLCCLNLPCVAWVGRLAVGHQCNYTRGP